MNIRSIVLSALLLIPTFSFAQIDSAKFSATIKSFESEISVLKNKDAALSSSVELLNKKISVLETEIRTIKKDISANEEKASQLEAGINKNAESLTVTTKELGDRIETAQGGVNAQSKSIKRRTIGGAIIALIVLCLSVLIAFILHQRGNTKIEKLKQQADKLNEEIVNKFSVEMSDMQKISTSIGALSSAGATSENEQDLIKTLADRITFMEMTLYKMDNGIKGHKHLSRSISQMKDNMLASGYELVDMLGKPYSDGMKATASFEDDDTLEEGARIITKVIKPQINYKGVMIQNAQITVSQNI